VSRCRIHFLSQTPEEQTLFGAPQLAGSVSVLTLGLEEGADEVEEEVVDIEEDAGELEELLATAELELVLSEAVEDELLVGADEDVEAAEDREDTDDVEDV